MSGPGALVGVDNGNSADTTSYKEKHRKAFSGKVLAIVQSTGGAGTAQSNGLTSDNITITTKGHTLVEELRETDGEQEMSPKKTVERSLR